MIHAFDVNNGAILKHFSIILYFLMLSWHQSSGFTPRNFNKWYKVHSIASEDPVLPSHHETRTVCRQASANFIIDKEVKDVSNSNNNKDTSSNGLTIAIVGAGVGGLAVASRIASSPDIPPNTKVVILEKNSAEMKGGRCGSFFRDVPGIGTFRFERGPSLLLLKDAYLDLFKDCGVDVNNEEEFDLRIEQCAPAYQVVFDDGDAIQLGFPKNVDSADKEQLHRNEIDELEEISRNKMNAYEHDGAMKWDEYMKATAAFLDCGLPNFIEERFDLKSFPSFVSQATREGFKSWPLNPHSDVLDKTFSSNKMKALASFQNLYVGLEPYRNNNKIGGGVLDKTAPAVFGLLAALELHPTNKMAGVFAPIGGFAKISEAFETLATKSGVDIRYNYNVQSISSDGIVYTEHSNDDDDEEERRFLPADMVIVNADLPYSTKMLMNSENRNEKEETHVDHSSRYDWDDKFDFSSGVIAFYWSVKKKCKSLNTHNVFLVSRNRMDMEKSWSTVRYNDPEMSTFDNLDFPFNFYVHRASVVDESAAPPDCDSLMILVPCCTLQRDERLAKLERDACIEGYQSQFDNNFISKVKELVLQRLGALDDLSDLHENIVDEVVNTPATYAQDYNLAAGTPFALSHGFKQLSLTRPGQASQENENTLFVGASTRPGNGVPLVLLGAKQVAKKALSKLRTTA